MTTRVQSLVWAGKGLGWHLGHLGSFPSSAMICQGLQASHYSTVFLLPFALPHACDAPFQAGAASQFGYTEDFSEVWSKHCHDGWGGEGPGNHNRGRFADALAHPMIYTPTPSC